MTDPKTLKTYADMAEKYADLTDTPVEKSSTFASFVAEVTDGGHVLDLGCGPGNFAAAMADAGFTVTATDAVPEMVALAAKHAGVQAEVATFDDITGEALYDGIWANFSLLHAAREDMPRHLNALHKALKPGGIFHIALKSGEGSKRDKINRLYAYYTQAELTELLTQAGFTVTHHASGNDIGMDGVAADWIALRAHG